MRQTFCSGVYAVVLTLAPTSYAASGSGGACIPNPSIVSAERATQFLENPVALLDRFSEGQGGLASEVRDLVSARPETIEAMRSLAKAGSEDQSRAIGAGLGTAASVCVLTQPTVAQQIQETVLRTENAGLIQAFVSITGDIPTEAIVGADADGDTTPGGGRNTTQTGRPGAVSSSQTISLSAASSAPATFGAASVAGTATFVSVSPSN